MLKRRTSAVVALIVGPILGAAYPFIQNAVDCRAPQSEACVWGKALMPIAVILSTAILGAIFAAVIFAALEWRRRSAGTEDESDK